MNGKRSTVFPAILAIAIAVGVIGLGIYAGIPINLTTTSNSQVTTNLGGSTGNSSTTQSQTSSQPQSQTQSTGSQGNQQTSSQSSSSKPGQGTLAILLTDPPNIPQGVTKIYVTYANLEVHISNAGNQSGWTEVQSQGEIQLLGTLNVSQTLSTVKVPVGEYNQIRFNISSAEITYNSANYTAFVQSAELVVPIVHGVPVNATGTNAAIIDISPTVVNIGSSFTPEFIIKSVAVAYPVPSGDVTGQMQQTGGQVSLNNQTWWQTIEHDQRTNLTLSAVTLTPTSLSLTVGNTGQNWTQVSLVIISSVPTPVEGQGQGQGHGHGILPGSFQDTAIFAFTANGTLIPLLTAVPLTADADQAAASVSPIVFRDMGYNLTAGASVNLSYNGPIQFGFLRPSAAQAGIVQGQTYLVTVLGTQTSVSTTVVAS